MKKRYMEEALKQATIAFGKGEVPVGAVIVKDNKIIAKAYNQKESTKDVTNHAEIIAIKEASRKIGDWRLNGCTLFVTLKPCEMCKSAAVQARMDQIVYGTESYFDDSINYKNKENIKIIGPILEQPCAELLRNFFKKKR